MNKLYVKKEGLLRRSASVILLLLTLLLCLAGCSGKEEKKHSAEDQKLSSNVKKEGKKEEKATFYDGDVYLSTSERILIMMPMDSYCPTYDIVDASGNPVRSKKEIIWSSEDGSIATVDDKGKIRAMANGITIIHAQIDGHDLSYPVNVISDTQSGNDCSFTLLTGNEPELRNYHLFKQNTYQYTSFPRFIGWHGCAHCSVTTILSAFKKSYQHATPDKIINGIEKEMVSPEEWSIQYEQTELGKMKPISMYGISNLLTKAGVKNEYIPSYDSYQAMRGDILAHLRSGYPVVFEARKKNSMTGQKTRRWTNSVHTMIFLGAYTDDKHILVCDSIDRKWYQGGQRCKIVEIDDIMAYMFPSTESSDSFYYESVASDGGYIKIME